MTTLGCKVNQFESASFLTSLEEKGVTVTPFSHPADIYIVNTCTVTGKAASQSRQLVRRALRTNPGARVVVTGCCAQVDPEMFMQISKDSVCVVGNGNKRQLVDIALSDLNHYPDEFLGDVSKEKEICFLPVKKFAGRTRAFLKIQDGCNSFCSYCIVPYARGRSRSLPPLKVVEQMEVFAEEGVKEIVLTGIHSGCYGRDLNPRLSLLELLEIINRRKLPIRYRLSSLELGGITPEMLQFMKQAKGFMPHFHIPLQSGDNSILKKMNRRYTAETYMETVEKVIEFLPTAAVGVDVLVGFPGEDDQAFLNTLNLLESLPVAYLHVFPFSKRPGTPACEMEGQVPNKIKKERVALLRELDHKKRVVFYGRHVGQVHSVLAESARNRFRMMKGFTENYIPVYFQAPASTVNQVLDVKIERLMDKIVFGMVVS